MKELVDTGFLVVKTIVYYDNRPFPYTELWQHGTHKIAVLIDHGICEMPVCGATWSYRSFVEEGNAIAKDWLCLRYLATETNSMGSDLEKALQIRKWKFVEWEVSPRKNHPQLLGKTAYGQMLGRMRASTLHGDAVKMVLTL